MCGGALRRHSSFGFAVLSKTYIDITYSSALGTSQESEKAPLSHFLGFLI
jgi:hypothetical protein